MSYTYASFQTALSTATAVPTTDANFIDFLPSVIDYAEGRIYRDLNMLVEDITDGSSSTSALSRNFTLPTSIGTFQIVTAVNIITPASTAPDSGTRNPCSPCSRDVLDMIWPSIQNGDGDDVTGVPALYNYNSQAASIGQSSQPGILFGPWPDDTYRVEVVGKIIPTPLSASTTTTFLTLYLPDLFFAASMIMMTGGLMKNFGAQSDSAREAVSWETQYQTLLKSAADWEARKRFSSASWTSRAVEPMAQPQRG